MAATILAHTFGRYSQLYFGTAVLTGSPDGNGETGLAMVAIASAATSWSALGGLATLAGIHGSLGPLPLAWLVPLAIETCAAGTSTCARTST